MLSKPDLKEITHCKKGKDSKYEQDKDHPIGRHISKK